MWWALPTLRSYPEWRDTYSQIEETGEVPSQEKRDRDRTPVATNSFAKTPIRADTGTLTVRLTYPVIPCELLCGTSNLERGCAADSIGDLP